MKRFIEGENRLQSTLFPERLDDYIADDNAVRVVDAFVELCRELELFSATLVAIDGSKFKAVNNRDNNYTQNSVKRRLKRWEREDVLDKAAAELHKRPSSMRQRKTSEHCNRRENETLFAVRLSAGSSFYTASARSGHGKLNFSTQIL
jgi:hypothetical protein